MCQAVLNPSAKSFRRKCQIAIASCLVLYMVCSQASLRMHHTLPGVLLSAVAGAAFFGELFSAGLLVFRLRDEFQRILLTRSFLWATVITMGLCTIWGFIDLHPHGTIPHLDLIWIPMILVCLTAVAKLLLFRQYRPGLD